MRTHGERARRRRWLVERTIIISQVKVKAKAEGLTFHEYLKQEYAKLAPDPGVYHL